ncbi:MAG: T9SS type A sorting domain-containing protein, partial [Candidatus Kapaibacterium sp.]
HIVTGDTAGVGITVYGYGLDESYAWAGSLGVGKFPPVDTVPPLAEASGMCDNAFVHLADSGVLQSKLNLILVDSDYNLSFSPDPAWIEGVGFDTSGYGISVIDLTKPGYLRVAVYDEAGNSTTITSTYVPDMAVISPPIQDFGTVSPNGSTTRFDTIRNLGKVPFSMTELKLSLDTEGFTLVNPDMSPLAPDSSRLVEIQFQPKKGQEASDTILFGDECSLQSVVVEGNAGASVRLGSSIGNGITLSAAPNPVTGPEVTFGISNRNEANITLTIYDMLGREVGRPVNNTLYEAGIRRVSYDVSKLPSGTYTCRLSANGSVISKQFVIER